MAEFLALFPGLLYTSRLTKERQLVKYVLSKISRASGHAFTADLEDLTIEHLVPQSSISRTKWTEEIVGQLGNLILITKDLNQKLENKSFADKKALLLKHKCKDILPEYFWEADHLTPELIIRRTTELAEFSYNSVWKI